MRWVFCDQNPVFYDQKPALLCDQKPAWCTNAAIGYEPQVKGHRAQSRPRITVMTSVYSGHPCVRDECLSPLEVMIKAAPRGRGGSYQRFGMMEHLEEHLKPAGEDYESQVVYVDISRSGPIDPAVAELIESRGQCSAGARRRHYR